MSSSLHIVAEKPLVPLITVGITCFNAAETIERALQSAFEQDWENKEIIVVDDASTDESFSIIESFALKNPNIRVIRHESNKGYPGALNTLLSEATGEFLAFFDDDDESRNDRLTLQWKRIIDYEQTTGSDMVFCYTNRLVVRREQKKPTTITQAIGRSSPEPHGTAVSDFLLCLLEPPPFVWGQFGSCTLMVRRSVLLELGGFDVSFRRCAEWDIAIRAGFKDGHFVAVDLPLVTQHLTPGIGSEKSGRAPLRYSLALRRKHRAYLLESGLYWASVAQAYARFHYSRGERWRHRMFTGLACLFAPTRLLQQFLRRKARSGRKPSGKQ